MPSIPVELLILHYNTNTKQYKYNKIYWIKIVSSLVFQCVNLSLTSKKKTCLLHAVNPLRAVTTNETILSLGCYNSNNNRLLTCVCSDRHSLEYVLIPYLKSGQKSLRVGELTERTRWRRGWGLGRWRLQTDETIDCRVIIRQH